MEKQLTEKQKSRQQEKSYHLLFSQIADHCVANGIDIKMATEMIDRYRPEITKEFVKSTWRAILKSQTGKTSTTEQTTTEVKAVQQEFGKLWSEITGETFDWPSIDNQNFEEWYNK